jgi:hypothetical protein
MFMGRSPTVKWRPTGEIRHPLGRSVTLGSSAKDFGAADEAFAPEVAADLGGAAACGAARALFEQISAAMIQAVFPG